MGQKLGQLVIAEAVAPHPADDLRSAALRGNNLLRVRIEGESLAPHRILPAIARLVQAIEGASDPTSRLLRALADECEREDGLSLISWDPLILERTDETFVLWSVRDPDERRRWVASHGGPGVRRRMYVDRGSLFADALADAHQRRAQLTHQVDRLEARVADLEAELVLCGLAARR